MNDQSKTKQQLLAEVSQLRQQMLALQNDNLIFQAILNKAPILISAKDLQGNITLANERCNVLENVCNKQVMGVNIHEILPPHIAENIWQNDLLALSTNQVVEMEETITHKDQKKYNYYTVRIPLTDADDNTFGVASLSYNITELKQSLELSITDKMTALYSWRYFNMRFTGELSRAQRNQNLFSLLILEIDHFDDYKASYGENKSDDVICHVADAIQNVCNHAHDLCFRLAENKMACILTESQFKEAQQIAEEIRDFIYSLTIEHRNNPQHCVTVSIGVIVVHYTEVLEQAEIIPFTEAALHKAQALGGNHICLADKI